MKQIMKNNFGPLWPSDEQYHWNAFPKPTNIFSKKKYVRLNNLKTESWKKNCILIFDAFRIILKFFYLRSKTLPVPRSHFRSQESTSGTNFSFFQCQKISSPKEKINNWIFCIGDFDHFLVRNRHFLVFYNIRLRNVHLQP